MLPRLHKLLQTRMRQRLLKTLPLRLRQRQTLPQPRWPKLRLRPRWMRLMLKPPKPLKTLPLLRHLQRLLPPPLRQKLTLLQLRKLKQTLLPQLRLKQPQKRMQRRLLKKAAQLMPPLPLTCPLN